jgi:electron transport complex protein RnfD
MDLFQATRRSTSNLMVYVTLALLPGIVVMSHTMGLGVIINIGFCVGAALLFEGVCVALRKRPVMSAWKDGSIILAAVLLALALPPLMPLWQLSIGVIAMVFLGKHLFGGLGHNPFNPAMVGYAVLLVSFPKDMTAWLNPDSISNIPIADWLMLKTQANPLSGLAAAYNWDAITMATPLDRLSGLPSSSNITDNSDVQAIFRGSPWIWINVAFLAGGLSLLLLKVIRWHIPISMLVMLVITTFFHQHFSSEPNPGVTFLIFSGATMLGAFFIATDPVTAAASNVGRLIYGAGIGLLTYVLREFSGYPEGIAFAVLLMNMMVPAIDALVTRDRLKT